MRESVAIIRKKAVGFVHDKSAAIAALFTNFLLFVRLLFAFEFFEIDLFHLLVGGLGYEQNDDDHEQDRGYGEQNDRSHVVLQPLGLTGRIVVWVVYLDHLIALHGIAPMVGVGDDDFHEIVTGFLRHKGQRGGIPIILVIRFIRLFVVLRDLDQMIFIDRILAVYVIVSVLDEIFVVGSGRERARIETVQLIVLFDPAQRDYLETAYRVGGIAVTVRLRSLFFDRRALIRSEERRVGKECRL